MVDVHVECVQEVFILVIFGAFLWYFWCFSMTSNAIKVFQDIAFCMFCNLGSKFVMRVLVERVTFFSCFYVDKRRVSCHAEGPYSINVSMGIFWLILWLFKWCIVYAVLNTKVSWSLKNIFLEEFFVLFSLASTRSRAGQSFSWDCFWTCG